MNKIITQEEIERAAEDYVPFEKGGKCYPNYIVERACCRAFKDGANYALGKQEKDAADIVISGWVCRDKVRNEPFTSDLFIVLEKPTRVEEWGKWCDCGDYIELDSNLFPDLTWESEPLEVEIIIKRRNEQKQI